jgi:hypothetical protein
MNILKQQEFYRTSANRVVKEAICFHAKDFDRVVGILRKCYMMIWSFFPCKLFFANFRTGHLRAPNVPVRQVGGRGKAEPALPGRDQVHQADGIILLSIIIIEFKEKIV